MYADHQEPRRREETPHHLSSPKGRPATGPYRSVLDLQRTAGNQAVQRLLRANSDGSTSLPREVGPPVPVQLDAASTSHALGVDLSGPETGETLPSPVRDQMEQS